LIAPRHVLQLLTEQGHDGFAEGLRLLVNEAMRVERHAVLQAQPYERTATRQGYANGYKPKTLTSRVGPITFSVPQVRGDTAFYPSALEKGLRSDVAAHLRSTLPGRFTTLEEHRPKAHQKYLQWTPSRILEWVKTIGPDCARVVAQILADRPHPEQGYRSALGIIQLGKALGNDRVEAAARRALHFGTCSYVSLKSILQNNLEAQPLEQELPPAQPGPRKSPRCSLLPLKNSRPKTYAPHSNTG
jgi:hypothetical protein